MFPLGRRVLDLQLGGKMSDPKFPRDYRLSFPRQQLLAILHDNPYCKIQDLRICQGEPVFDPPPVLVDTLDLKSASTPRFSRGRPLTHQHWAIFRRMDLVKTSAVMTITVSDGVPVRCETASILQIN